eukprot:scaffold56186_cov31-Tisochrysis_lutea.AAC.1
MAFAVPLLLHAALALLAPPRAGPISMQLRAARHHETPQGLVGKVMPAMLRHMRDKVSLTATLPQVRERAEEGEKEKEGGREGGRGSERAREGCREAEGGARVVVWQGEGSLGAVCVRGRGRGKGLRDVRAWAGKAAVAGVV